MPKISPYIKSFKRRWWLIAEFGISLYLVYILPLLLEPLLRLDIDIEEFTLRIGSDALTLMGFTIASLAIIAKQIDRPVLDNIRTYDSFSDLWVVFGITATMLGGLALLLKSSYIFILPSWLNTVTYFLLISSIFMIADCIILLLYVVSIINEGRMQEIEDKKPAEPVFDDIQ